MNLTSKRLVTCLMTAGLCAFAASAATFEDTFEASETWNSAQGETYNSPADGMELQYYKFVREGDNDIRYWTVGDGDQSKIKAGDLGYTGTHPTNAATTAQYLDLNTEGGTASRKVDEALENNVPVYVDTLIKFTPCDEPPEIAGDSKLAIWLDSASNLVVKSKTVTFDGEELQDLEGAVTDTVAATAVDPDAWHRLTVATIYATDASSGYCQLWLDDNALDGVFDVSLLGGTGPKGFPFLTSGTTLATLDFQGTGGLDELVVTKVNPFPAGTAIILTLNWEGPGIESVVAGGETKTSGATVDSGTTLTITAKDWYRITGITGATVSPAGPYTDKTVTVTPTAEASATVTITAAALTDSYSQWALNTGHTTEDADRDATFANYLLNVGIDVDATISITQIAMDGEGANVTVKADADVADINAINGQLVIEAKDDLASTETDWAPVDNATPIVEADKIKTIKVTPAEGKDRQFYRAVIKAAAE